jgi:hypothetical protein
LQLSLVVTQAATWGKSSAVHIHILLNLKLIGGDQSHTRQKNSFSLLGPLIQSYYESSQEDLEQFENPIAHHGTQARPRAVL